MAEKNSFTIDEDLLEAAGAMLPGEKAPSRFSRGKAGRYPAMQRHGSVRPGSWTRPVQ